MSDDFEMLKRVAQKWIEPLDDEASPGKTVGEWRREVAQLMSEVVTYVSQRSDDKP